MFTRWVERHFRDADHARETICTISGVLAAVAWGGLLMILFSMR